MNYRRRNFLTCSIKTIMVVSAGLAGLFRPLAALANRNIEAFRAETTEDALGQLFPGQDIQESSQIDIGVHDLIENGAVVPVNIETSLPNVSSISVLADKNPNPLIAKLASARREYRRRGRPGRPPCE